MREKWQANKYHLFLDGSKPILTLHSTGLIALQLYDQVLFQTNPPPFFYDTNLCH